MLVLVLVLTTLLELIAPKGLDTNGTLGPMRGVCQVGTVGKISDCKPRGPGFDPWPGRGLKFGQPSPHRPWTGTLSRWSGLSTFYWET